MKRLLLTVLASFSFFLGKAEAVVLDWNNFTWTSGSLSQSFELDSSNPGNDITITISGDTGYWQSGNTTTAPVVDNTLTGGNGNSADSLLLAVNWPSRNNNITVTITFNYTQGVSNVAFTIFDVDMQSGGSDSGFVDKLSKIYATGLSGSLVAPTLTGSTDNSVSGSGTNQTVIGTATSAQDSSDANVGVSYGTNAIKSLTFTYGDDSSAPNNPGLEWIGLYDITYRPRVPEYHPAWAAAFACVGLILLRKRLIQA